MKLLITACLGSFFVLPNKLLATKNRSVQEVHTPALLSFVSLIQFGSKQIILPTHTQALYMKKGQSFQQTQSLGGGHVRLQFQKIISVSCHHHL